MTSDVPIFQDTPTGPRKQSDATGNDANPSLPAPTSILWNPDPMPTPSLFQGTPRPTRARKRSTKAATTPTPTDTTPAPRWIATARPGRPEPAPVDDPETATTFAPVETRYAGCRFRSRLEARYAVWFDHLGIEWQYEPETYRVGPEDRRRGYLPDFFLPADSIWVEVKGSEQALDYRLLLDAADPDHGLPRDLSGLNASWPIHQVRLAILGPVPAAPSLHAALSLVLGQTPARQLVTPFCDMAVIGHPEQVAKRHEHTLAPMYYPIAVDPDDQERPTAC